MSVKFGLSPLDKKKDRMFSKKKKSCSLELFELKRWEATEG